METILISDMINALEEAMGQYGDIEVLVVINDISREFSCDVYEEDASKDRKLVINADI